MILLGTIANAAAIVAGGLIGLLFKGRISDRYTELIFDGLSLCIILIGLVNAFKINNVLLIIFSIVIGSILGQWWRIEERLENFSHMMEQRFSPKNSTVDEDAPSFSKGFVTTTLIYCIGSMAIVGAFESGLANSHQTLYAKAVIDGTATVLFASSLGIGTLFSAIPVFIYQGSLALSSTLLKPFLTEMAIADMSSVGGLLILAIGLNMLKLKKIPVGNMIPAIFIPLVFYIIKGVFHI